MTAIATRETSKDGHSAALPDTILNVLEEVCGAAGFGPHTQQRSDIADFLTALYANGYFTVDGLRQAFLAYVEREVCSRASGTGHPSL